MQSNDTRRAQGSFSYSSPVSGGTIEYVTRFTGTNDRTLAGTGDSDFDTPDTFSVGGLVRVSASLGDYGTIISKQTVGYPFGYGFFASPGAPTEFHFMLVAGSSSSMRIHTSETFAIGQWLFCFATWDGNASPGAAGADIWVNDDWTTRVVDVDSMGTDSFRKASARLSFGCRDHSIDYNPLVGYLQHMQTWNKVLSTAELTELYNAGNPVDPRTVSFSSSLISYWPCGNGDTYPTLQDRNGSADMTMTDMTAGDIVPKP